MKIEKFEDILAWQKSRLLNVLIHKLFKDSRDYCFRDQIQRATLSISNNIAEGFERKTNKELKLFLYIAKGSCGEVRSMLYNAVDFKYINIEDCRKAYQLSVEISRLLSGFIKTL